VARLLQATDFIKIGWNRRLGKEKRRGVADSVDFMFGVSCDALQPCSRGEEQAAGWLATDFRTCLELEQHNLADSESIVRGGRIAIGNKI
jgi:hypothetical protein